ncbi:Gfo/Idh/MocA family oxidoreductase [Candidatus Poribacteria bacterium]|nr:Gfo/Idh/MocA family oxidoreductase [Candidatus Poribacteria bacterium]
MAKKTYRVGIIGCGGMGRSHAGAWTKTGRAEVVTAIDMNADVAARLAGEFSLPTHHTDPHEMLEKEDLDIVSITTWQSVRAELTIIAAEAGVLGILGEKPMSASVGEADDMIAACEKSGTKLAIGHQRRFSAQNSEARRLTQEGAIGQPQAMLRRDGEGLLNRGTHEIDEMRYILGDPEPLWVIGQVSRKTDKWERRVRCEDLCMGEICFEGGIRGVYESDLPGPGLRGDAVYGSDGQLRRGPNGTVELLNSKAAGWQTITPRQSEPNQFQEMIAWLDGEIEEHRSAGRHARCTMAILMAIYESLRIKDVVRFPFQTRANPLDLMVEGGALPVFVEGRYDIRAPFPEQQK